jgi:hypothetical protein
MRLRGNQISYLRAVGQATALLGENREPRWSGNGELARAKVRREQERSDQVIESTSYSLSRVPQVDLKVNPRAGYIIQPQVVTRMQ